MIHIADRCNLERRFLAPFVRVHDARLRHNRDMPRLPNHFLLLAAAILLAGCDGTAPSANRNAATPMATSAMEFRGQRPCADCDGIEAWLRLEQAGKRQPYRLIEHYRSGERELQFEDAGEWQAEGDLLRLRSRTGGERVYARLSDGALEARDAHGLALPAAADDVMLPVTFDGAP